MAKVLGIYLTLTFLALAFGSQKQDNNETGILFQNIANPSENQTGTDNRPQSTDNLEHRDTIASRLNHFNLRRLAQYPTAPPYHKGTESVGSKEESSHLIFEATVQPEKRVHFDKGVKIRWSNYFNTGRYSTIQQMNAALARATQDSSPTPLWLQQAHNEMIQTASERDEQIRAQQRLNARTEAETSGRAGGPIRRRRWTHTTSSRSSSPY